MPFTKLCRRYHIQKAEKDKRERERKGSVRIIFQKNNYSDIYFLSFDSFILQVVVEALFDARDNHDELEYEDLLAIIEKTQVPEDMSPLSNESLVNHASFVVGQVTSYEEAGDEDEEKFMVDMPCMRDLIKLTGVEKKTRKSSVKIRGQGQPKKAKPMIQSMATTTPLIRGIFDDVFADQIDTSSAGDKKSKVIILN